MKVGSIQGVILGKGKLSRAGLFRELVDRALSSGIKGSVLSVSNVLFSAVRESTIYL